MDLNGQLRASILAQNLPHPSATFLNSLITARSPPPPLLSLLATAKARLLAADLTSSTIINTSALQSFPVDLDSTESREKRLPRPVHVQVLDVENLTLSRWEQVEEMEAVARGETTRGREVIRVTAEDDDQDNTDGQTQRPAENQNTTGPKPASKNATHRLVLQDCKGAKLFALELRRFDGIGVGKTQIGEKILLKAGTVVARGMILLEPDKCIMLGGKIETWQKTWVDGRLTRLKEEIRQNEIQAS
ncbi:RecQ-mediated genome instability protein 1 [Fusarium austroafricanum]|uniref:RecQ-mediated genome instability protein 1 n=1 Tax=Fusarium austroafricanum TaxID=2364996 RepID=A0A8H4JZN3_9HYPO|nr:RecQ-mediated genome instability protein 1 [Fusarium austroafricanum]